MIQYGPMRRANGLTTVSRRGFCGGVVSCLGLATVASCIDGNTGVVTTGPLGGPGGSNGSGSNPDGVDAGVHNPPPPDAPANMGTCPATGATDVGMPSAFAMNTPQYFSSGNFFVVRDSGGLYALTARCTHEGATCVDSQGELYCPRHGAEFTYNGDIISGPVSIGLVHYAMCTMSNGHVGVDRSQTVSKSQRLNA